MNHPDTNEMVHEHHGWDCRTFVSPTIPEPTTEERFRHIAEIAADAVQKTIFLTVELHSQISVEQLEKLSDLAYQLGYIEGLSHISGGEE